jgi:hypothetical protein
MDQSNIPRINFTISDNARRGFEVLRQWFNGHSPDPAGVLCVGWGRFMPNAGSHFENVVISFYGQSQLPEIAPAIQEVSGLKIVFLPTAEDHRKFAGKVLDFAEDRGFFLTVP